MPVAPLPRAVARSATLPSGSSLRPRSSRSLPADPASRRRSPSRREPDRRADQWRRGAEGRRWPPRSASSAPVAADAVAAAAARGGAGAGRAEVRLRSRSSRRRRTPGQRPRQRGRGAAAGRRGPAQFIAYVQATYMNGGDRRHDRDAADRDRPDALLQQSALEQYQADHQSTRSATCSAPPWPVERRRRRPLAVRAAAADHGRRSRPRRTADAAGPRPTAQQQQVEAQLAAQQQTLKQAQSELRDAEHISAPPTSPTSKQAGYRALPAAAQAGSR